MQTGKQGNSPLWYGQKKILEWTWDQVFGRAKWVWKKGDCCEQCGKQMVDSEPAFSNSAKHMVCGGCREL